jgi:hypothetical protein
VGASLLSLLACAGDDRPAPLPAIPTTLPANSPPAASSATPHPIATPARPPTAAPPTPPPASNLSFRFGAGVDPGDRAIVTNAIEASRKVLLAYGAINAPSTVLANDTLPGLSEALNRLPGQDGRAADVVRRLQNGVAEAGYRTVSVYTGGRQWRDENAVQRSQTIAHEYAHVVQLELMGRSLAEQTFVTRADQTPPGGPFWFFEGSAEILSWAIIEELRLGNLEAKLREYGQRAAAEPVSLRTMESYVGYVGAGPGGIATAVDGVWAVIGKRPAPDLFRFWALIGAGHPWQNAFILAFGQSVGDFYQTFEASR